MTKILDYTVPAHPVFSLWAAGCLSLSLSITHTQLPCTLLMHCCCSALPWENHVVSGHTRVRDDFFDVCASLF